MPLGKLPSGDKGWPMPRWNLTLKKVIMNGDYYYCPKETGINYICFHILPTSYEVTKQDGVRNWELFPWECKSSHKTKKEMQGILSIKKAFLRLVFFVIFFFSFFEWHLTCVGNGKLWKNGKYLSTENQSAILMATLIMLVQIFCICLRDHEVHVSSCSQAKKTKVTTNIS